MAIINTIPHITWRHTEANSVDVELSGISYKAFEKTVNNEIPADFHDFFKDKKYGLSEEMLKLNEELKNYEDYYLLEDGESKKMTFVLNAENNMLSDIHGIHLREGLSANLIFDYKSEKDIEGFRNSVYKIKADKDSSLKIVIIQRLSALSKSFMSLVTELDENANVELVHIELGSKASYSNVKGNLTGFRSNCDVKTAYFVDKDRYLDLAYEMTQMAKETNSDMVINGVLKDFAKKRFAGTLDFKKGCTLSTGNEEEFVTLLDPTVRNWAIPLLLAREDDIVGNHAASAGRIDKDMLFYITSRGFDKLAAKRIIIESKLRPVFDLINDDEIAEELLIELREGIK